MSVQGNWGEPIGYTRLKLEYQPCPAQERDYPAEQRGFLKQWLFGKEVHKDLTVKATINPLGVSQSREMLLLHRNSSNKGESWNTAIGSSLQLTRYFLIDKSTAVSIEFSFVETSKYSAAATAAILDVVQRASALIAPSSTLITADNKKKFNEAATFVDGTISGLLARELKEKTTMEYTITGESGDKELARIVVYVPEANSTVSRRGPDYQPVGMWTIKTEGIVKALLGRETDGKLIKGDLSAPTVMSFMVGEDKTLAQYLAGQTAVSTAKDAYLKENAKKAGDAEALCSAVAIEAAKLGLSPADVGGAVWAYAKLMEPGEDGALNTACSKIDRYPA